MVIQSVRGGVNARESTNGSAPHQVLKWLCMGRAWATGTGLVYLEGKEKLYSHSSRDVAKIVRRVDGAADFSQY